MPPNYSRPPPAAPPVRSAPTNNQPKNTSTPQAIPTSNLSSKSTHQKGESVPPAGGGTDWRFKDSTEDLIKANELASAHPEFFCHLPCDEKLTANDIATVRELFRRTGKVDETASIDIEAVPSSPFPSISTPVKSKPVIVKPVAIPKNIQQKQDSLPLSYPVLIPSRAPTAVAAAPPTSQSTQPQMKPQPLPQTLAADPPSDNEEALLHQIKLASLESHKQHLETKLAGYDAQLVMVQVKVEKTKGAIAQVEREISELSGEKKAAGGELA